MNDQTIRPAHRLDDNGRPAGGVTEATGVVVVWQNGPLGRGDERLDPNGAFVETVIRVALDRLRFYQSTDFACDENSAAIDGLWIALAALNKRTERRETAGTEGTHDGD